MFFGSKDYFKLGDHNAWCDVCGFKFKASELRKRWDGMMCCPDDWEKRHEQDFLKSMPEKPAPPWSRPRNDKISDLTPSTFTSPMDDNAGTTYFVPFEKVDGSKL
jgi:hypothetical protein